MFLSFFIPSKYAEYGYAVMIILKFYSCGIVFSIFARARKHSSYATLCGAIIYTFSAVLFVGFYQSFFINPLIIFPLLILGVDYLYEKDDPKLYVIMLAISFVTYFYFAYMMCILVVLYFIIKLVFEHKKSHDQRQHIMPLVLKFILFSILAVGISAISLLPSLIVMLHAGRLGLSHYLPLLFNRQYYIGMLSGFTTGFNMLGRDCNIGWGAIALVCVIALFTFPKKNNKIKFEFILMTIGLLIPFVGHIMNGFSYTANRWVWSYNLLVAYIVTLMVPELSYLSKKQICIVTISVGAYIIFDYFLNGKIMNRLLTIVAILLFVIIATCIVFKNIPQKFYKYTICIISCICVVCLSYFSFSKSMQNSFANNVESGKAFEIATTADGLPILSDVKTSDGTRFDTFGLPVVQNATWLYGVSGINFYVSVYNNNIDEFHDSIGLNRQFSYMYKGLERRSELEALMGVNHFFVNGNNISKPVGYQKLEAGKNVNGVPVYSFSPEKKTSMFYLFDRTLSYKQYNKADPITRQQMLMQACVTNKETNYTTTNIDQIQKSSIDYQIKAINGVSIKGKDFNVTQQGGQVELDFTPQTKEELYVYLKGITYKNGEEGFYSMNLQGYYNNDVVVNASSVNNGTTEYSHMHGGKTEQLINLGAANGPINRVVITFNSPGRYTIKNLQILSRDANSIQKNMSQLNGNVAKVFFDGNEFGCNVNINKKKRLFTSVPYSTGWRAYDNGKKIRIDKTDVAFMSIQLKRGHHQIVFKYRTPGLYEGLIITLFSIFIFTIMIHKINLKNCKEKGKKSKYGCKNIGDRTMLQ
ncbi:MAG: YfhO family protein [Coriobacteriales bacterium]